MPRWFATARNRRELLCSAALFALCATAPALGADEPQQPRTTYGTVGLIEMPSARMAPDGQLSAGISFAQHIQRYNVIFQALPWLETSLRYSGISHFQPSGSQIFPVYWDRSFAAKLRLFEESRNFPSLAVGINDLVGTGVYGGEYVVASKRFGPIDTTLGLGWGRLAGTALFGNPLINLSKSFENRPGLATAGGAEFKSLFHGPKAALFGGVVWHTPIEGLSLNVEYSSDKYTLESTLGSFTRPKSQLNYGITYQAFETMSVSAAWLYDRTAAVTLSFQTDPTSASYSGKVTPTLPEVHIRTREEQQRALALLLGQTPPLQIAKVDSPSPRASLVRISRDSFVDHLLQGDGYGDVQIEGRSILITTQKEESPRDCRAMTSLAQTYGGGFQTIVLESGPRAARHTLRCDVSAAQAEAALSQIALIDARPVDTPANDKAAIAAIRKDLAAQDIQVEALAITAGELVLHYNNERYFAEAEAVGRITRVLMAAAPPRIEKFRLIAKHQREFIVLRAPLERAFAQNSSAEILGNAITMQSPAQNDRIAGSWRQNFPRFQWSLTPQFRQSFFDPQNPIAIQLVANLSANVEIMEGLDFGGSVEANIFNNYPNRLSDSLLPHVRTDAALYVHQGGNGIADLVASYKFRLAPNLFAQARIGYLESMFGGAGGEILWRPEGSRWALGADLYRVKQRNFDRLLGFQNYSVTTGHMTAYFQSPWYDLNFAFRAGQYLAGDRGVTVQITRRFSTGVEIGAFFTKTNVSAAQFGEGSFDKGIVIRIPLGWALPIETQGQYGLDLRPVQRDGGQILAGDATLYGETFRTSEGEIYRHSEALIAP